MEAEMHQEDELRKEAKLKQEVEIRRTEVNTTEEGEGYRTIALDEEEARDNHIKEDGNKGTTASGEKIDRPDEDAEQDNDVFNGDKDFNQDAVMSGSGSEAEKWESGESDGEEDENSLEAEKTEESA